MQIGGAVTADLYSAIMQNISKETDPIKTLAVADTYTSLHRQLCVIYTGDLETTVEWIFPGQGTTMQVTCSRHVTWGWTEND